MHACRDRDDVKSNTSIVRRPVDNRSTNFSASGLDRSPRLVSRRSALVLLVSCATPISTPLIATRHRASSCTRSCEFFKVLGKSVD